MDVHTKAQRSYNMSRVRSKNTLPERLIFDVLKKNKLTFKKHYKLSGKPDVVFLKKKIAVFIDGEFWHGKNFKKQKSSLPEFWFKKIGDNIKRDKKNRKILKQEGWEIIRLWDKDILKNTGREAKKIIKKLNQD